MQIHHERRMASPGAIFIFKVDFELCTVLIVSNYFMFRRPCQDKTQFNISFIILILTILCQSGMWLIDEYAQIQREAERREL